MSEHDQGSRFAYVSALTPLIFGTTYLLTTNFLPPDRPLLAALLRSLPTGLVLVVGSRLPNRQWLGRFLLLSVLWASAAFPLLFLAAYRLPGGVAAVINSLGPICVVLLAVPALGTAIRGLQLVAGALGVGGGAGQLIGSVLSLPLTRRIRPSGLASCSAAGSKAAGAAW